MFFVKIVLPALCLNFLIRYQPSNTKEMKETLLVLFSILFSSIVVSSQELEPTNKITLRVSSYEAGTIIYKVTLKEAVREPCFGSLISLKVIKEYSFLKNLPDIECDLFAINCFKINQYIRGDSIPNQIYLFTAVNEAKKEKYVAVDANNNHDFSDDKLYVFSLPQEPLTREEKRDKAVGLPIILDIEKHTIANIGIDPFNFYSYKYGLPQDERLEVVIVFTDFFENTQVQIDSIPIEIYADGSPNLHQRELNEKTDFTVYYKSELKKESIDFVKGDTIQILDKLLTLTKIEHPNIYLKEIGLLADSSKVGSHMPGVYAKDLSTNDNVRINDLTKNKYVLIDFWGSWCGPCIASIPKLKDFYEKVRDRQDILILSIAKEEDRNDLDKLNKIISEKEIDWPNLWLSSEESKISTSIIKKLNIAAFPTYLIVDKEGKIVYKEKSMYKTDEAIDFFLNLIHY